MHSSMRYFRAVLHKIHHKATACTSCIIRDRYKRDSQPTSLAWVSNARPLPINFYACVTFFTKTTQGKRTFSIEIS